MKLRWMGITGLAFVLAALVGGSLGPSLWPTAFWSGQPSPMMGQGMMGGGMMGPGMMSGGMMGAGTTADSNAPFDQRFLDQMIVHHQGAVMSAQMMIADCLYIRVVQLTPERAAESMALTEHIAPSHAVAARRSRVRQDSP